MFHDDNVPDICIPQDDAELWADPDNLPPAECDGCGRGVDFASSTFGSHGQWLCAYCYDQDERAYFEQWADSAEGRLRMTKRSTEELRALVIDAEYSLRAAAILYGDAYLAVGRVDTY